MEGLEGCEGSVGPCYSLCFSSTKAALAPCCHRGTGSGSLGHFSAPTQNQQACASPPCQPPTYTSMLERYKRPDLRCALIDPKDTQDLSLSPKHSLDVVFLFYVLVPNGNM